VSIASGKWLETKRDIYKNFTCVITETFAAQITSDFNYIKIIGFIYTVFFPKSCV